MSVDFIHCNLCFAVPDQTSMRKFVVSDCGHLMCPKCRERGTPDHCGVCSKKCNLAELGKLEPTMQHMFTDPFILAKKQQKQMMEALNFQKMHRARFMQGLQHQMKKARKLHESMNNESKKRHHLERENQALKDQVTQLKRQLMSSAQTPCLTPDPMVRYRTAGLRDNSMTVSSTRTAATMDSGSSLPIGAEAANYRHQAMPDFRRARVRSPVTPFLDSSMSTPPDRMGFNQFEPAVNMSRDSISTLTPSNRDNDYHHTYAISAINNVGGASANTTTQMGARIHNNSSFNTLSHITAAFQRAM